MSPSPGGRQVGRLPLPAPTGAAGRFCASPANGRLGEGVQAGSQQGPVPDPRAPRPSAARQGRGGRGAGENPQGPGLREMDAPADGP